MLMLKSLPSRPANVASRVMPLSHTSVRVTAFLLFAGLGSAIAAGAAASTKAASAARAMLRVDMNESLRWSKHTDEVDRLFIDGSPSDLQLPSSVELEVARTGPGGRGNTASGGGNKPATLETGATIQVPLFVNIGDRVKVQTATGEYMSRA